MTTNVRGTQILDGSVSLTVDVSGVLPVANGGTNSNTLVANNALLGNGSGAVQQIAPGTSGNVFSSNGTTWGSSSAIAITGAITSSGAGIGYATGAGGAQTQATSRTTTVVLSKLSGKITLFTATLAADTDVSFTWTNTFLAATDVVVFNVVGGAAVKGGYHVDCIPGAGSATVTVRNHTPTITASEAPQLQFVVIKGVAA